MVLQTSSVYSLSPLGEFQVEQAVRLQQVCEMPTEFGTLKIVGKNGSQRMDRNELYG